MSVSEASSDIEPKLINDRLICQTIVLIVAVFLITHLFVNIYLTRLIPPALVNRLPIRFG